MPNENIQDYPPTSKLQPLDYAANLCGVSVPTIRRWIRAGLFPCVRLPHGPGGRPRLRVEVSAVEQWLLAQSEGPDADGQKAAVDG